MKGRKTHECEFHYFYRMHPQFLGPLRTKEEELVNRGYERYGDVWVDFDLPEIGPSNPLILSREYKERHKHDSGKKLRKFGRTPELCMLVREALEDFGPQWDRIRWLVKGRSPAQLKKIYEKGVEVGSTKEKRLEKVEQLYGDTNDNVPWCNEISIQPI